MNIKDGINNKSEPDILDKIPKGSLFDKIKNIVSFIFGGFQKKF